MNEISSRTESKTETQITESDDGHGNTVETENTVTQTYLYITVSHKTAEEMVDKYGFNDEQRQQLSELLAEENNSLWSAVLCGITIGDGEIITVALPQVGNAGSGATLSGAALSTVTASLPIKIGQKKNRGAYSSVSSFALHSPFTVASITESSLSSNLLSFASKRLRTELFLTSLSGKMYSSTDTSNIVIS